MYRCINRQVSQPPTLLMKIKIDLSYQSIMRLKVYQSFPVAVAAMASNVNNTGFFSLEQLCSMKCSQLREILKENKQIVSGNKQILVARCYALNPVIDDSEEIVEISETSKETRDSGESFDPLGSLKILKGIKLCRLKFYGKRPSMGN